MFQTFSVVLSKLKISISTRSRSYYMYFFLTFDIFFYLLSYLQYFFLEIIYSEQKLLVEHRTEFKITICCVVDYLNIIWNIRLRIRKLNMPTTFMFEISDNWRLYLIKAHGFNVNLLSSVERLKMRIEVIFLKSSSASRCCPNFYRVTCYRKIRYSVT